MLGRIISMAAGRSAARSLGGAAAGPAGVIVGALLPTVLRLGPAGMIAAAVGGYAVKKAIARRDAAS